MPAQLVMVSQSFVGVEHPGASPRFRAEWLPAAEQVLQRTGKGSRSEHAAAMVPPAWVAASVTQKTGLLAARAGPAVGRALLVCLSIGPSPLRLGKE